MPVKQDPNFDNDNFEILDVEDYHSDKLQVFNHQVLVMEILRKVSEAGSHELRAGWFNERVDNQGNVIRMYIEDTRKKFIETVKTAMTIMSCDFDTEATDTITAALDRLKGINKQLKQEQWNWFQALPPRMKQSYEGKISTIFFNVDLGWYLKSMEEEVECYREVLEELHNLTKRLDFYKSAELEG